MRYISYSELIHRNTHLPQTADLEKMRSYLDDDQDDTSQLAVMMEKALGLFGDYVIGLDVGFQIVTMKDRGQRHTSYGSLNGDGPFVQNDTPLSVSPCYIGIVVEAPGRTWHLSNFESGEILVLLVKPGNKWEPIVISLRAIVYRALVEETSLEDLVAKIKIGVDSSIPAEGCEVPVRKSRALKK